MAKQNDMPETKSFFYLLTFPKPLLIFCSSLIMESHVYTSWSRNRNSKERTWRKKTGLNLVKKLEHVQSENTSRIMSQTWVFCGSVAYTLLIRDEVKLYTLHIKCGRGRVTAQSTWLQLLRYTYLIEFVKRFE